MFNAGKHELVLYVPLVVHAALVNSSYLPCSLQLQVFCLNILVYVCIYVYEVNQGKVEYFSL